MSGRAIDIVAEISASYSTVVRYSDCGTTRFGVSDEFDDARMMSSFETRFVLGAEFEFAARHDSLEPAETIEFGYAMECKIRLDSQGLSASGYTSYCSDKTRTRFDRFRGRTAPRRLQDALLDVADDTSGASCLIPRLLLPTEIHGRSILDLDNLRDHPDVAISNTECHHISGQQGSISVDLWVATRNKSIIQIRRTTLIREVFTFVELHPSIGR